MAIFAQAGFPQMKALIRPALFALLLLPLSGQAQFLEGVEYTRLNPQPVETGAKVEVREFFWYGCGHCYALEPHLDSWLKTLPKNVQFIRTPGVSPEWLAHAQAYYAFETLGLVNKLHKPFFDAVQAARQTALPNMVPFSDEDSIAAFVTRHGVDAVKFREVYRSFDVGRKVGTAKRLNGAYQVRSVPILFVDGKYMTNANIAGGHDKVPKVLDFLIKQAAAERSVPKK
jgi:thiol:disulfide interchange protein DsbA